jgi:dUTP pyrophosphatase
MLIQAQVIRVNPKVDMPKYATAGAAAVDLQAAIEEPLVITPGAKAVLVPTGLKIYHGNIGLCSMILPRSGLGHKHGLVLGNLVGLIDSDYQGELMVSAYVRPGHDSYTIKPYERFAQLAFVPVLRVGFDEVSEFHEVSDRGDGGFGSTGK